MWTLVHRTGRPSCRALQGLAIREDLRQSCRQLQQLAFSGRLSQPSAAQLLRAAVPPSAAARLLTGGAAIGLGSVALSRRMDLAAHSQPAAPTALALPPPPTEWQPHEPRTLSEWLWQQLLAAARATQMLTRLLPLLISAPLLLHWKLGGHAGAERWWRHCVRTSESSGALFIKLAQWASSRPDLFSEAFCSRFAHLQDHTPTHSWAHTEAALDQSFGPQWREELTLQRDPIGSGCIAQVHRGTLVVRDADGTERSSAVAVKVLHPEVERWIEADMRILRLLSRLLQLVPTLKWLNPAGMADEFAQMLMMQLDLRLEAHNLERFRRNFTPSHSRAAPLAHFPQPHARYVSARVLTEEYVSGEPILTWARRQPADSEMRADVCNRGIDAVCQMLFVDNFTHGDLHPGNMLVTDSGELCMIDAGIALEYTTKEHEDILRILGSFIRYDGYEGGRLMAAQEQPHADVRDLDGFCKKMQKMVWMARDCPTFFDKVGEFVATICAAACEHRVKLAQGFLSVALSVKVVEGVVIQIDPHAAVAPRAKEIVIQQQLRRRLLPAILVSAPAEPLWEEVDSGLAYPSLI